MTTWKDLPGRSGQEQLFVIGDVHGQAGALNRALGEIRDRTASNLPSHLIFTGDIIDRGPDNLGAIESVMNAKELAGVDRVTFLPGNHELMLLDAIRAPQTHMTMWTWNGGMAVLDEVDPEGKVKMFVEIAKMVKERLADYVALIEAAPDHLRIDDLLFVHAGIAPDTDIAPFLAQPREETSRNHWAWIRGPFLKHTGGWKDEPDLVVVHGHTPHNHGMKLDPDRAGEYLDRVEDHRRICVDAGAAGMDQVALLEVREGRYTIETICERPFEPFLDTDDTGPI